MNLDTESPSSTSSATAEKAFSFISKGWREVKDSADADFQLMRARAKSFKKLATSFDRELENFFSSASPFSVPAIGSTTPTEINFVKSLQPKLSEFRRVYSSPDFSRKVLDKWKQPRPRLWIDLSAIRNAIVSEIEENKDGVIDLYDKDKFWGRRKVRLKDFRWEWKGESEEKSQKEWEPIRAFKMRLREFERKSSSSEIFSNLKNNEFVEKLKSSLVK